jgi:hypothetical protein
MTVLTSIFAVLEACFAVRGRLPIVLRTVSVVLRTAKHPSSTVNYRPKDERHRPKDGKAPFKVQFAHLLSYPQPLLRLAGAELSKAFNLLKKRKEEAIKVKG